jgi:rhodanese-related sulfurtransferase
MLNISVQDLKEKLDQEEIEAEAIIDVRTPNEHLAEKIAGTTLIPLNEIQSRIEELKKFSTIYIYCATGNRSEVACHLLAQSGIKCYNVESGIMAWIRQGFPTEKGEKQPLFNFFG